MGKTPQQWLNDGDVVEIDLEGVGSIKNKVVFSQTKAKL
jgi:2-keto-4-pentenoate hydratase/2-oxohepta-3-ene-1,7-dioic acid hydratase in catechol pathway